MSCTCDKDPTITCIVHPHALTIDQIKAALPEKLKKSLNPVLIAQINTTLSDPEMYEQIRENLISYTGVMNDGRFKLSGYVSAVKYVSHKLCGKTNLAAYELTFPENIQRFLKNGVVAKDIASYVSAYNKSKLVNLIMEQTLVPSWVLNQDLFQKALNVQASLMTDGTVSPKVRSDAANSLLTHLKQPETKKIELDIGVKKDSSIQALRDATMEYVAEQKRALASGSVTAQDLAHAPVVIEATTGEVI